MAGGIQERIDRAKAALRAGWRRLTRRPDPPTPAESSRESESASEDKTPVGSEIVFTSLGPAAAARSVSQAEPASAITEGIVCPVTRQTLKPGQRIFQCCRCHTAYSPEGWAFLRKTAAGRCCNCQGENTVVSIIAA